MASSFVENMVVDRLGSMVVDRLGSMVVDRLGSMDFVGNRSSWSLRINEN